MDEEATQARIERAIAYGSGTPAIPIGLRLSEALYRRLVAYAHRTRRTLANAALVLVEQALMAEEAPPASPAAPPPDAAM